MKTYFIIMLMLFSSKLLMAQSVETISSEITFSNPGHQGTVMVANVNGDVRIKGTSSSTIKLTAQKTITASTTASIEKGKKEANIKTLTVGDTVIIYLDIPNLKFGPNKKKREQWDYDWNCNGNNKLEYNYLFDVAVEVPTSSNIIVSTINDGDISVENINGSTSSNNINGNIKLNSISGSTWVNAINGTIDLEYNGFPKENCRFYSLNGDIHLFFPKGLNAQMRFQSFNGKLYTNIPYLEPLEARLDKQETEKGLRYRITGNYYKIGKGGPDLDIETFNSNVYIKEINNN